MSLALVQTPLVLSASTEFFWGGSPIFFQVQLLCHVYTHLYTIRKCALLVIYYTIGDWLHMMDEPFLCEPEQEINDQTKVTNYECSICVYDMKYLLPMSLSLWEYSQSFPSELHMYAGARVSVSLPVVILREKMLQFQL